MTLYITAARIDENGNARGGQAGDQTGREVMVQKYENYWNGGWECTLRYAGKRSNVVRNRMIRAAYKLAQYNWVGYDQDQRTTLYSYLYSMKWELKATYKTYIQQYPQMETDCSQLMGCIANIGVCGLFKQQIQNSVPKDVWTGNMVKYLKRLGFEPIWSGINYKTGSGLEPGDILLNESHHTALFMGNQKKGEYYIAFS